MLHITLVVGLQAGAEGTRCAGGVLFALVAVAAVLLAFGIADVVAGGRATRPRSAIHLAHTRASAILRSVFVSLHCDTVIALAIGSGTRSRRRKSDREDTRRP